MHPGGQLTFPFRKFSFFLVQYDLCTNDILYKLISLKSLETPSRFKNDDNISGTKGLLLVLYGKMALDAIVLKVYTLCVFNMFMYFIIRSHFFCGHTIILYGIHIEER